MNTDERGQTRLQCIIAKLMRTIDEAVLRAVITPAVAVDAMREAFRADGEGRAHVPAVINLDVPAHHGEFHVKTALIEGVPHVAVKIASGFYDNPSKGLPSGSGLMAVFDAATGMPVALLFDNGFLTDIRTGAAGAVAADVLGPERIATVGVIGSGLQARHQVRCLRVVRDFTRIVVWSRHAAHRDAYCREMRGDGFDVIAVGTPEEVCREADIVITATPSKHPLVRSEWLRPGQHVTALGSDSPGKQELDPGCLDLADLVVVDRMTQCAAFGELRHAIDAGLQPSRVHAELGEVVAGMKLGRTAAKQISIADLTGVGFQDTAIASRAIALIG
jgi:ornithine cyclodeaminase/alanine dehydrogenase-like protein (mu-crystallin family)